MYYGWKFIVFGLEGKFYVLIGVLCNVCDCGKVYVKIICMNVDGSGLEDVVYGICNLVGFDWQLGIDCLWFIFNGCDLMGDDLFSDMLNEVICIGQYFGFLYCYQGDMFDLEFGKGKCCVDYILLVFKFGLYVVLLGMCFYIGKQFLVVYWGVVIIVEYGLWNCMKKFGYWVMIVWLKGSEVVLYELLVIGFMCDEKVWGWFVDVQMLFDGSLLISDDLVGVVYWVIYCVL